ncbi:uncharacterized protein LOC130285327 [Hyla sarda]|uniref:uncharacterized protein LOC130285327 n=1 Tax=Hyla sarda TaxID=327740 RepID=UPI0024C3541D|nr:uncharacterized protein LOC130285327 [Hyla sarda]
MLLTSAGRENVEGFFEECNIKDDIQMISTRNLEYRISNLAEKEVRLFWTVNSLKSYDSSNRVPRGLRQFKEASQFHSDPEFQAEWLNIQLDSATKMMRLILKRNEKEYSDVTTELSKCKTELSKRLTEGQSQQFLQKLDKKLIPIQAEIKERKKDKFLRDKMDYDNDRIFNWQQVKETKRRAPRKPQKSKPRNRDYWTSDTGSNDEQTNKEEDNTSTQKENPKNAKAPPEDASGGTETAKQKRPKRQVTWMKK